MCNEIDNRNWRGLVRITERLADDLVTMHNDTAIELEYWENARLLVEKYYHVDTSVKIGEKYTKEELKKRKERGY